MSEGTGSGSAECAQGRATRRLMVVDAAEESRVRLAAHCRALGYEVTTAADGVEALTRGLAAGADVVLMSLTLPGLDGYEVAAILSRIHPRVRIILTGPTDPVESSQGSQWTGSFRCVPTPLDVEALGRALREAEP